MPKSTAVDFVMSRIAQAQAQGPKKSWFSRLPKAAQERMSEIKDAYLAGKFAGAAMAKIHSAIVALCREHKWQEPKSVDTIARWMRSSDI